MNTDSRHLIGSGGVLEGNHTWPCGTGILFEGADDRVVLVLLIRSPSFARSSLPPPGGRRPLLWGFRGFQSDSCKPYRAHLASTLHREGSSTLHRSRHFDQVRFGSFMLLLVLGAQLLCTAAFSPLPPAQMGSVDASDLH